MKLTKTTKVIICHCLKYISSSPLSSYVLIESEINVFQSEKHQVKMFGSPTIHMLVNFDENSSNVEESTFMAHGIILKKDFPPFASAR